MERRDRNFEEAVLFPDIRDLEFRKPARLDDRQKIVKAVFFNIPQNMFHAWNGCNDFGFDVRITPAHDEE